VVGHDPRKHDVHAGRIRYAEHKPARSNAASGQAWQYQRTCDRSETTGCSVLSGNPRGYWGLWYFKGIARDNSSRIECFMRNDECLNTRRF
jgi:hypothetical protein